MIKVFCDGCKQELNAKLPPSMTMYFRDGSRSEPEHYCEDCMKYIRRMITAMPKERYPQEGLADNSLTKSGDTEPDPAGTDSTEEPARTPDLPADAPKPEEPRHSGGKKPSLDYGKIMALYNAKWSGAKIADEMGMSTASVYNAIHKYKKQHGIATGRRGPQEGE